MTQLDLDAKEPLLSEKSMDEDEQDHDSDDNEREHEPGSDHEETHRSRTPAQRRGRTRRDSYGEAAGPSSSRRPFLFIACFLVAIWLAYSVHLHRARKAKRSDVIYASRYSKEHKYRPAASPIITETLKDGRIRLRGATPPPETPTPTPTRKARRTRRKGGRKKKAANKASASK